MAQLRITGPDGRTMVLNTPDDASTEQITAKVAEIKSNWNALSTTGQPSTAPEDNPNLAGPLRPTMADLDLQPSVERPNGRYLSPEQVTAAREAQAVMRPDEAAKTRRALAENEARFRMDTMAPAPAGFGASGAIAPHLVDKGMAAVEAGLNWASGGKVGQPYDEAVETHRLMRDRNWEENPVETFVGGLTAVSKLPAVSVANPASKSGWIGNAAATGGVYGGIHGAGSGDGWQEGFMGALTEAGIGTLGGAVVGKLTSRLRPQDADEIRAIQNAEQAGVRLNRGIASSDPGVQQRTGLLSKMPYVGEKLQKGINTAVDDVRQGVDEVSRGYRSAGTGTKNPTSNPLYQVDDDTGIGRVAVDRVASYIKKTAPDEMEKGFASLSSKVPANATTTMGSTRRLVQALKAEDFRAASEIHKPAIDAVTEALKRPGGMSYQGLLDLRRNVGALLKENLVAKAGTAEPAFKRLYRALTQDLRNLVASQGQKGALGEFDKLMRTTQRTILRRQGLEKIIGKSGDVTPERLVQDVARWAGSGPGKDFKKLVLLRRTAGDDVMNDIAALTLQRMVLSQRKAGEFSIANFDKGWKSLSPAGKRILFGGQPDLVKRLDALSQATDDIQRVLGEVNNSKTSYGNFMMRVIDGAAGVAHRALSGATALVTGGATGAAVLADLGTTAGAGATAVAAPILVGRLIARDLNKPATVRSLSRVYQALAKYVQAPDGVPTANAIVALRLALEGLADEAARSEGVDPNQVRQEIFSAVGVPPGSP